MGQEQSEQFALGSSSRFLFKFLGQPKVFSSDMVILISDMKKLALILIMLLFVPIIGYAVDHSTPIISTTTVSYNSPRSYNTTIGVYNISFDMGFGDYYITAEPTKETETLNGEKYNVGSIDIYKNANHDSGIAIISITNFDKEQTFPSLNEAITDLRHGFQKVATRTIDGVVGVIASSDLSTGITLYMAQYHPSFDSKRINVTIFSNYPWDEGTLQPLPPGSSRSIIRSISILRTLF